MRRYALGIVAGLLLLIGAITTFSWPREASAPIAGPCIKAGLVLGALWLALPQLQRMATGIPRRLLGWFVRTDKKPPVNKLGSQPLAPSRPRPRRRSNS